MVDSLYRYSNMLKDFIIDELSGPSNKHTDKHRYNNLKISMDLDRFYIPHILIRIGISEGVISLETGDLIYGSLGQDPKYIKKWLKRGSIYTELLQIWNTENLKKEQLEQTAREEILKAKKQNLDDFFN